jgi:hypothetical protein
MDFEKAVARVDQALALPARRDYGVCGCLICQEPTVGDAFGKL